VHRLPWDGVGPCSLHPLARFGNQVPDPDQFAKHQRVRQPEKRKMEKQKEQPGQEQKRMPNATIDDVVHLETMYRIRYKGG